MGTFIRFFNLNDANKPPEDAQPQAASDSGERPSLNGKTLAAGTAGSNGTGDAEMAQPELLETVAGTAGCSGDEKEAEERPTSGLRALTSVAQGQSVAGEADEDDDEEEQEEEETPAQMGGELVGVADFEALFQRYQTPIINFVFRLVGNREQAYDLAQDVFVKAYKALAGGTKIHAGALSSWLYRIAANTATDALRRKRLIAWLPLSLFNEDRGVGGVGESGGSGAEENFPGAASLYDGGSYNGGRFEQRVADREIVDAVLGKLPEKYSVCLLLYEHEGFSCNEIADILKVSPSAVKMRLMRARERFIALYQQEVDGP